MRLLKIIGITIIAILSFVGIYIYTSGPELPHETDGIIENIMNNPLPQLVVGENGHTKSGDINIWYESISPKEKSKGAILIIMGISNDAMGWPPKFIQAFVDAGYQVIRYDHRGTGMSDWLGDWDSDNPYSLKDMAGDGVAVLNTLGIEKAHVIGISMGGMIAQEFAIEHPDRIKSLTSMMSSGYAEDTDLPKISGKIAKELIKTSLKYGIVGGDENMIKLHLASRIVLMGNATYDLNIRELSEHVLYNIKKRRGYNPSVSKQHQAAVLLSGSRYKKLNTLSIPTLIVHGKSDPFIPIEHGKKCASVIQNADTLWIDNMGHDIPDGFIETISKRIITNFK